MLKNIETFEIIRNGIRGIIKNLEKNDKLRFDTIKRNYIYELLLSLDKALNNEPDYVFPILVSLNTSAKVYGFQKELKIISGIYTIYNQKVLDKENIKSMAYI